VIATLRRREHALARERDELDRLARSLEREVQIRVAQSEDQSLDLALKLSELQHVRESRESLAQGLIQDTRVLVDDIEARISLAERDATAEAVRALSAAQIDVAQLVQLAQDTRSVIQMEDGRFGLTTRAMPIAAIFRAATDARAAHAKVLGARLVVRDPPPGLTAIADPRVIGRVLDTLLASSIRAAGPSGEVTLAASDMGSRVEVTITERGLGMTEEERERSLDKWRYTATMSAQTLGAAYHFCRLAVEAHGGRIRLAGDRHSTRWLVSLPAAAAEGPDDAPRG
jgi:signal transduction histidine kinase